MNQCYDCKQLFGKNCEPESEKYPEGQCPGYLSTDQARKQFVEQCTRNPSDLHDNLNHCIKCDYKVVCLKHKLGQ